MSWTTSAQKSRLAIATFALAFVVPLATGFASLAHTRWQGPKP